MRKVCAWCKEEIDPEELAPTHSDAPISHGICPNCATKFLSFMGKPMRDFLDEFSGPVFLVDANYKVISANRDGLALIHKKPDEVEEEIAGDVFECPHALQAAGCGNTIHCKACTIRNTITATAQTGQANLHVQAYADLHSFAKHRKVKFSISTEKLGVAVLLRIDEVV